MVRVSSFLIIAFVISLFIEDYSRQTALQVINDELANNLGNLLSRATARRINSQQLFPPFDDEIFRRDYKDDGPALVEGLHYLSGKKFL